MNKHRLLLALLTIAATLYTVSLVRAQNYPTDDEVNAIAKNCTVGLSQHAAGCMRDAGLRRLAAQIRDQLADGWSENR